MKSGLLLAVFVVSVMVPVAFAGGPAPENRAATFAGTCKGGVNKGAACTQAAECPGSSCDLSLDRAKLTAVVTFLVDDDVSAYDGGETYGSVRAATLLVEVKKGGVTHLLAQTYQNLSGATLAELLANLRGGAFVADTFDPVTEGSLTTLAATTDVLARFLFQSGDSQLATALRNVAGVAGNPVVLGVPRTLDQATLDDHSADGLASALRLKVKIGFTL